MAPNPYTILSPKELLQHWQGHRGLTRRVIETFPEDKLFSHSIGGMRTFGEICHELIQTSVPTIKGIVTGKWENFETNINTPVPYPASSKENLLKVWDWSTEQIDEYFPLIPLGRFQETDTAFGQWEGKVWWILFYIIDNEIHHRGQGYVYLRSLGIEPPGFWDR